MLLRKCAEAEFWNDQGLNLAKFQKDGVYVEGLTYKEKAVYRGEDKISLERFLAEILEIPSNSKLVLIIPRVVFQSKVTVVSQEEEYAQAVASLLGGSKEGTEGICHICGLKKSDLNTIEYSAKFSRSNIGKVFVTTQVNYAADFKKTAHQQNFGICKACYERFMSGEKTVEEKFRTRIARQSALVLFEGVDKPVTSEMVEPFKWHIDAAFNPKETQEWIAAFRLEVQDTEYQNVEHFQFHIIFYQTDGKSYKVLKTIEDISQIRFEYVNRIFEEVREEFGEGLPNFLIGHLYNMVPVTENKKGDQLDIQRLLDLFGVLIKGETVEIQYIFELACEALEKGIREIGASAVRNYRNLYRLEKLHQAYQSSGRGKDWFIERIVTEYIALIKVLQRLQIADKEVFTMDTRDKVQNEYVDSIAQSESYLEDHGFSSEARGLFYLGQLIYQLWGQIRQSTVA